MADSSYYQQTTPTQEGDDDDDYNMAPPLLHYPTISGVPGNIKKCVAGLLIFTCRPNITADTGCSVS
jgi:hypothetical protein